MSAKTDQDNERTLQLAISLHQNGRLAEAKTFYEEILQSQPSHLQANFFLGLSHAQQNNLDLAAKYFGKAAKINPGFVDAHFNCGLAFHAMGNLQKALDCYSRAIKLKADHADALYNRGVVLNVLGRHQEALQSLDKALSVNPDHAGAWSLRGFVLSASKRFDEALQSCDRAIRLKPDYAEAHANRAATLSALMRFDEALQSCDRAIKLMPIYPEAYSIRGVILYQLHRFEEALQSYDRAIQYRSDHAESYVIRGFALREMNRFEEALQSYDRAIKIKPDYAEAYANRGVALRELRRFEEAIESFARALKIQPRTDFLAGDLLRTKMFICDWSDYSGAAKIFERVTRAEEVLEPFPALALTGSPDLQRKIADIWIKTKYPASDALGAISKPPPRQKIRLGYFSSDLRNHPVALSIAELFERHDRSRFELIAFSFGPDTGDAVRQRLKAAFDKFIDVKGMPDREIALLARKHEIDIGIDLNGFTQGARTGIFAMRPAPIQASYLGYAGTMGADYIDYLIADPTAISAAAQKHYSEKIVHLPNSFFPSDRSRQIADRAFTRSDLGLPPDGFVFCCFNNNYKILPDMFDSWMRILGRVAGSVLWLRADNEIAAKNLRKEASARNIDPNRLIFAPRVALDEHLARHRAADLFLDTLPYNAHATASDALWAGLPVLTQIGETFAGRVAASLLNALHLPELATASRDAYEALAVELAADPSKLSAIKRKLADHRLTTPSFDTGLLTKHLEAAYVTIYERYHAGLPPDHLSVPQ